VLLNTFSHIKGVGLKTEARFWASGLLCWDDFVPPYPLYFSPGRAVLIREELELSRSCLAAGPAFFAERLPSHQHWRIFPHFRQRTAYLDIETTGLDTFDSHITTIVIYDGNSIAHYVHGENLEQFRDDIREYEVIITYNGKCFDVPLIERLLDVRLTQVHIDLRHVLRRLGFSGGLKGCERQMGLDRGILDGVDGYFAVVLWQMFRRTGSPQARETLLAYNAWDTLNLEHLMVTAYNLNLAGTPFARSHRLPLPSSPEPPFRPDPSVIREIRRVFGL